MPNSKLVQFAAALETTVGTAETLTASDVLVLVRAFSPSVNAERFALELMQDTSSKRPDLIGTPLYSLGVEYPLIGPGSVTTDPAIDVLFKAAVFDGYEASTLPIGSVTGTFVAGETVTGGTSSATGMVLKRATGSPTTLAIRVLTGTFDVGGEALTGGTSGATASSSAGISAAGYVFQPGDWRDGDGTGHHVTFMANRDGYHWTARGGLADLNFRAEDRGPMYVSQTFSGIKSSDGDQALFSGVSTQEEDLVAPKFVNTGILIDGYNPEGCSNFALNFPTNPTPVTGVEQADGFRYSGYSRGDPTITLEFDQVAAATKDYFATLEGGTTFAFECEHGADASAGRKWTFSAPAAQLVSIAPIEGEPERAKWAVELKLTGTNNDELFIWQH